MSEHAPWYDILLAPFRAAWNRLTYPWSCCEWHTRQIADLYRVAHQHEEADDAE